MGDAHAELYGGITVQRSLNAVSIRGFDFGVNGNLFALVRLRLCDYSFGVGVPPRALLASSPSATSTSKDRRSHHPLPVLTLMQRSTLLAVRTAVRRPVLVVRAPGEDFGNGAFDPLDFFVAEIKSAGKAQAKRILCVFPLPVFCRLKKYLWETRPYPRPRPSLAGAKRKQRLALNR
jgi:hypothetical protein